MTEATLLHGFEERDAVLGRSRVRYRVAGRGSAVVLVHGLGGAATNWSELARLLAARWRVVVPDLPGHGGSDAIAAATSLEPFADAVRCCLEQERLPNAAVVGHSLGGAIGLRLALERPELVSRLVLAASAGISSTSLRAKVGLRVLGTVRPSRLAARYRTEVARSQTLKRLCFGMLAGNPAALTAESVHGFLAGSAAATDTGTAGSVLLTEDPREHLHGLRCPVLVLWGARDRFVPLEDGFEFARRLASPLRVLHDTGHLLIAERPEECARLIDGFLGDAGRTRAGLQHDPALDGVGHVEERPRDAEALR